MYEVACVWGWYIELQGETGRAYIPVKTGMSSGIEQTVNWNGLSIYMRNRPSGASTTVNRRTNPTRPRNSTTIAKGGRATNPIGVEKTILSTIKAIPKQQLHSGLYFPDNPRFKICSYKLKL